jgi:hypothetical protein
MRVSFRSQLLVLDLDVTQRAELIHRHSCIFLYCYNAILLLKRQNQARGLPLKNKHLRSGRILLEPG